MGDVILTILNGLFVGSNMQYKVLGLDTFFENNQNCRGFACLQIAECQFLKQTGLYCPWCGGTRALKALLKGNLIECLYYHPIVIYVILVGLLFVIRRIAAYLRPFKKIKYYSNVYIIVGFIIVMLNWLIKNVMLHMYKIMMK